MSGPGLTMRSVTELGLAALSQNLLLPLVAKTGERARWQMSGLGGDTGVSLGGACENKGSVPPAGTLLMTPLL